MRLTIFGLSNIDLIYCFRNSSFQLPGFCMPPMRKDEDVGCDSDGESFEAVTPEHIYENPDGGVTPISVNEKRSRILEDVDGELEMEDVAPSCEAELISASNHRFNTAEISHQQFEQNLPLPFAPMLPKDVPPSYPPLPTSPPPPPPPPPPQSAAPEPTTSVLDSTTSIHVS